MTTSGVTLTDSFLPETHPSWILPPLSIPSSPIVLQVVGGVEAFLIPGSPLFPSGSMVDSTRGSLTYFTPRVPYNMTPSPLFYSIS